MGAVSVLRHEMRQMLPPFLFFAVCFNLLALTIALLDPAGEISAGRHGAATVGALLTAKAVLLVDHLPFVNRYPTHPLIWNTVWKAVLYLLVSILLHGAERMVAAARHDGGFAAGWQAVREGFDWRAALAVHLWLAVLFLLYTAVREAGRAVGGDRMRMLFFGPGRPQD